MNTKTAKPIALLFAFLSLFLVANAQTVEGMLHHQSGDTLILTDNHGYLYSLMHTSNGDELGVAPGGKYEGEVVIPSAVKYQGRVYPVTTIRKNAMRQYADSPNAHKLESVSLPKSVTLVGTDAFRGNQQLKRVTYDNPQILIETRAYMECPWLTYWPEAYNPCFAHTLPSNTQASHQHFISPTEQKEGDYEHYPWAFFKNRHNGIRHTGLSHFDDENAMACICSNPDRVRGANFELRNPANAKAMFSGYKDPWQDVVLLTNNYVAKHHFPSFSRWVWGEQEVSMPTSFVQEMERTYGRKVRYSYQAAKVSDDGREQQVVVTEFAITNREAMVVVSWVVDGDVSCSWVNTTNVRPDYNPEEGTLWNVDDDGSWGIPNVMLIAQDDRGNVDLCLTHSAPESLTFIHLTQKGNTLVLNHTNSLYILYE
ncbi:MAG: hypothetical protein MJZ67_07005 [Bacteroidales bacterium]|nr:hypothetical protein [Bacteroidales bacterium]